MEDLSKVGEAWIEELLISGPLSKGFKGPQKNPAILTYPWGTNAPSGLRNTQYEKERDRSLQHKVCCPEILELLDLCMPPAFGVDLGLGVWVSWLQVQDLGFRVGTGWCSL